MRRFIAFILMTVSIILALVFNIQVVYDNKVLSNEYGGGTEFVYQITQKHDQDSSSFENVDVSKELQERFKAAGVKNADIELEEIRLSDDSLAYQARVKVGANTLDEVNGVDQVLSKNGQISFCTDKDVCYTQDEILNKSEPTKVFYSNLTPFPGYQIDNKANWDDLISKASEGEEEGTTQEAKIYIWENKFETDTYEKAFNEDEPDLEMQKKILATVTSENYVDSISSVIIQTESDGLNFTNASARAYVAARNSKEYNFEIQKLYSNKFEPTYGQNALLMALIGLGVIFILGTIVMIVIYGLAGFISSISSLSSQVLLMFIFSFLGFELSPAAFIGMIIVYILGLFISVNYFERIKDELRKPRNLDKANREGYTKSFMTTVDSCAVLAITSVFSFILATGMVQTLAAVTLIGSFVTFLITNYLNKWLLYWYCSSEKNKSKMSIYGLRTKQIKIFDANNVVTEQKDENNNIVSQKVEFKSNFKPKKNSIIMGSIGAGLGVLALSSCLAFGLSNNGLFNYSNEYVDSSYINVEVIVDHNANEEVGDEFTNAESFNDFLTTNEVLPENYTNMTFNIEELTDSSNNNKVVKTTYYISYEVDRSLISNNEFMDKFKAVLNEQNPETTLNITTGVAKPILVKTQITNIILVASLAVCWSVIYIFARFGISASIAHIATFASTLVGLIGLTSLLRLPFNSVTGYAFVAISLLLSFVLVPIFERNKEILKDRKLLKTGTREERNEILSTSLNSFLPNAIVFTVISCTSMVGFVALFTSNVISLSILTIIGVMIAIIFTFILTPSLYYIIRVNLNFKAFNERMERKRLEKNKKPSRRQLRIEQYNKEEANQPHETIIVGINEFK